MNEDQKKWLLYLQEKGIVIECRVNSPEEFEKAAKFEVDTNRYQFPTQPIPDIPDWRELCREMQSKGVVFETVRKNGTWKKSRPCFPDYMRKKYYRIPQQPIPEWKDEEMTEETKQEIPHRELQIQWHEDMLHHLRTGEPMPVWEYRLKNGDGEWKICHDPHFSEKYEYRRKRKPRTVTYWHCMCKSEYGVIITGSYESKDHLIQCLKDDKHVILSPITETTVELED